MGNCKSVMVNCQSVMGFFRSAMQEEGPEVETGNFLCFFQRELKGQLNRGNRTESL